MGGGGQFHQRARDAAGGREAASGGSRGAVRRLADRRVGPRGDREALDPCGAAADESRAEIVDRYRRAWEHSDATIAALDTDAPGHVPWWPRPDVMLFNILVHVLTETNRHAGHADILREQLDGAVGFDAESAAPSDSAFWANHRTMVEQAARAADPRQA